MNRATILRERLTEGLPDLVVHLHLYPTGEGGKTLPVVLGFGCPCSTDREFRDAWDGYPLVDTPMMPGEKRRVGFIFFSGTKAVEAFSNAERFYLSEGRLIGEALIVR